VYVFVLFFIFIFLGAIARFLVPFNTLTLDVVEVNQKKNLTELNITLLTKIRNIRHMFTGLQTRISNLTSRKNDIFNLVGITWADTVTVPGGSVFDKMNLDQLLEYVSLSEEFVSALSDLVKNKKIALNEVPIIKPVLEEYVVTGRYGIAKDPFTGAMKRHKGIDFSAEQETPVIATADGLVDLVDNNVEWGRRIRIKHKYGFSTLYAHLGTVSVLYGKTVKKGDVIATVGLSGLTTGPHLHYEIHRHNSAVDPEKIFFPDSVLVAGIY
jgi:murein DD-endopeptidase MepM/ murein hydrolase activator NlpD